MRNFANLKTPVFLSRLLSALPVDFALEAFACIKDDEHLVQRKEVSSYKSTWRSRGLSNTALDVSYKCKFISSYFRELPSLFQIDVPPFACRFNKSKSSLFSENLPLRCFISADYKNA